MPLSDVIDHLGGNDEISASLLAELSGLSREELAELQPKWTAITTGRRRQISEHLVKLTTDEVRLSFEGIFRQLLGDPDADVRCRAIEGLWECESSWLIEPLLRILTEDSTESVRLRAAKALGRFALMAEYGELPPATGKIVVRTLLEAVEDATAPVEVACQALESVAVLETDEVTAAITNAYNHHDERLQVSAIRAMGRSCNSSWLPILVDQLASRGPEIRREAAAALGQLGEEEALPHLADLIYDEDIRVRLATVRALGEIGGPEAIEALKQALPDAEPAIAGATEETLESLASLDDASSDFHGGNQP